ncbi:MAG: hypothetical protein DYH15_14555 [Nitrosomonas sp. PRO4]|nr:hypothetical protein [Nitrosomonas sp. PRO4]
MMKKRDIFTLDMFLNMPPAPVTSPGGLSCRVEIAHAMSDALRGHDRYDITEKMSKLLGRCITKHMLDAYTAQSREDHTPPYDTAIAFDAATGSTVLAELFAAKVGAKLIVGKEALDVELGKLERQQHECAQKIKALKRAMEDLQ